MWFKMTFVSDLLASSSHSRDVFWFSPNLLEAYLVKKFIVISQITNIKFTWFQIWKNPRENFGCKQKTMLVATKDSFHVLNQLNLMLVIWLWMNLSQNYFWLLIQRNNFDSYNFWITLFSKIISNCCQSGIMSIHETQ